MMRMVRLRVRVNVRGFDGEENFVAGEVEATEHTQNFLSALLLVPLLRYGTVLRAKKYLM